MSRPRDLLFCLLVRAFPPGFRERYGVSMRDDLEAQWIDARARGRLRLVGSAMKTSWNLLSSGLRERVRPTLMQPGAHRLSLAEILVQDLRFALRGLRKNPIFSATAIVTLGMGIGGATALFSVVDAVLLSPLPYPEPDRLAQLWQVNGPGLGGVRFSEPNFRDVERRSASFDALAAYRVGPSPIIVPSGSRRVQVAEVSDEFFDLLGAPMLVGRRFFEDEAAAGAAVMLVGEEFWRTHLAAEPDLSAVRPRIGDRVYSVVGVVPSETAFPTGASVWILRSPDPVVTRTGHNWRVIGRLRTGVDLSSARSELSTIAADLKQEFGDGTSMTDISLVPLLEQVVGQARQPLLILLGASGFLLMVSCSNVVNLLLARGSTRRIEIAMRRALGAGRQRLAAQFLVEAGVLALAGGLLGLILARGAVLALPAVDPGNLPRIDAVSLDGSVLAFGVAMSFAVAAALGGLVAVRQSGDGSGNGLTVYSRSGSDTKRGVGVQEVLTTLQIAMTLVLLVTAGLVSRTFLELTAVDTGFRKADALVVDAFLPDDDLGWLSGSEAHRLAAESRDVSVQALQALPGVTQVGLTSGIPLRGQGSDGSFLIVESPDEVTDFEAWERLSDDPDRNGYAIYRVATTDYFRAMSIPLLRGRLFDERDGPDDPPAAVISRTLADRQWPNEDPIGKMIQYANMDGDPRPFTIVGIVEDVRERLELAPFPTFYGNAMQRPAALTDGFSLVVVGAGSSPSLETVRSSLREALPTIPIRLTTLEDVLAEPLAQQRFSLLLLGAFAGLATMLAITGVYGIIAYLTGQRRREWAIRFALGASRRAVVGRVLLGGAARVGIGVVVGAVIAYAGTRLLAGLLYEVSPTDPVTFAGVSALLLVTGLAASYVPAVRAAQVDPAVAMRE